MGVEYLLRGEEGVTEATRIQVWSVLGGVGHSSRIIKVTVP